MKSLAISSIAIAVALSGCITAPTQMTQSEVDDLFAEAKVLLNDGSRVNTPDMPNSGSATYSGYTAIYDLDNVGSDGSALLYTAFVGEVNLAADFGANTLTGNATNFAEADIEWDGGVSTQTVGEAATGTLNYTNGTITGNTFGGMDLTGTLTGSDGTDINFDLLHHGNFSTTDGSGADYVSSNGSGTMNSGGGDIAAWSFMYATHD